MQNNVITVSELPDPNCTYVVTLDDVEYECVPTTAIFDFTGDPSGPIWALGNLNLFEGYELPKTKEPFLIEFFYIPDPGSIELQFEFEDPSIDHTISIDKVTTSIKPLDASLSRRIINFTINLITQTIYANIDANLSVFDLLNSVIASGSAGAETIGSVRILPSELIYLEGWQSSFIYNPYSGYVVPMDNGEPAGERFDISSSADPGMPTEAFYLAFLQYENGNPVMCNYAYFDENNNEILLGAAEPVIKDANGEIIHDFSVGPVIYDTLSGEFSYGNTEWPTNE